MADPNSIPQSVSVRFWSNVDKSGGPDACWPWVACLTGNGYGNLVLAGKNVRAHRLAYELVYGEIPKALYCCHRCDNPQCVNPAHLFLGTSKDNNDDMKRKGRSASGERHGLTTLTNDQVIEIRALRGKEIQRVTGERFGIAHQTVSQIQCGSRWTYLNGRPEPRKVRPRITRDIADAIRRDSQRPLRVVAAEYGVSVSHVSRIRNGMVWR